ncbi:MAG: AMP-binding protein, partial [Acidimicrobiales bacterium]|nr:AMP-binding protein [Acidimicrobiales bacterium]
MIGPEGEARTFDADAPLLDEGDALVATSSGSTGTPKVLVHTIAGLAAHASAVHRRLAIDPSSDGWLACLPLDHLGGFGVVARAILDDIRLEVLPAFDAPTVAAAPRDLGTTLTSLVPTALDRVDPAPFRWIVLGGSADPTARPANVVRTYGLTETGGGVVYDRQPLDGVEVRVVDDAIWLRSPTMARGRRGPDGAVAPIVDGDGWLRTGDLGRAGHDGLEVLGRADDLIVTGGENVWPA